MNLYALPALAAFVGCFAIGIAIGARRSNRTTPRAFGLYALIFALTYFTIFNQLQAESRDAAEPWIVASGVVWPFVVPAIWRFTAAFTGQTSLVKRWSFRLVLDLPALVIAALALFVAPFRRVPELRTTGWGHLHEPAVGPYGLTLVWLVLATVIIVKVATGFARQTVEPNKRKQAAYGIASGLFMLVVWFAFKRALPAAGFGTQWLSPIGVLGQIGILGYAIWRYDMFELTSPLVATDVLRKMQEGVLLADGNDQIVEANPAAARMLGYDPGELQGLPIGNVLTGLDGGARPMDDVETATAGTDGRPRRLRATARSVTQLRFAGRSKQGSEIPVSLSTIEFGVKDWSHTVFVLSDLSGLLKRTQDLEEANRSLRREVTERQRAEDALEERDAQLRQGQKMEAVGRLAGGVAHDFNNMLTVIRGVADLIEMDLPKHSELRSDFGEIITASDRAAALVRQLLAFSRRQVLRPVLTDLNDQVRELTTMLARLLGEDIELVTELRRGVPKVNVDTTQFSQVLMNLAVNARDAMPGGGRLVIRTEIRELDVAMGPSPDSVPAGTYAMLQVRDEGTGMPPEVVEHIFEPFFTTKQAGIGTGLGLATVYGIVRQSGGDIRVESKLDQGTTFTILLPEGSEGAPASVSPPSLRPEPGSKETILLVEDESLVRKLAERILRSRGYQVIAAESPKEAQRLAQGGDQTIDLVLTDVVMPGMSGFELAKMLREQRPDLPVVYMTGYSYDDLSTRGLPATDVRLVDKPFTAETLLRSVRKTLEGDGG